MNYKAELIKPEGTVEVYWRMKGGGPSIYCYPCGKIELFEIPKYGGEEQFYGEYKTLGEAMKIGNTFT